MSSWHANHKTLEKETVETSKKENTNTGQH